MILYVPYTTYVILPISYNELYVLTGSLNEDIYDNGNVGAASFGDFHLDKFRYLEESFTNTSFPCHAISVGY